MSLLLMPLQTPIVFRLLLQNKKREENVRAEIKKNRKNPWMGSNQTDVDQKTEYNVQIYKFQTFKRPAPKRG